MLNAKKFGLAAGILWGGSLFIITIIATITGYAADVLSLIDGVYPWYSVSFTGSFLGLIFGFLEGFIGFFIFAWLYNRLLEKK